MLDLAVIWLSLLARLAVIGVAGVRLSCYGDIIAEGGGLRRSWVGPIMLILRLASRVYRTVSWISLLLLVVYLYGH